MAENLKRQSEINRSEWVRWNWTAVTEVDQAEQIYIRGAQRNIAESISAGLQWDEFKRAYNATGRENG